MISESQVDVIFTDVLVKLMEFRWVDMGVMN